MHAPDGDRAADVDQPRLLLRMYTDMIASKAVGQFLAGRVEGELRALVQGGPKAFRTELLGQVAHAGQARFSRLPSSPKTWATPRHSSTA